MPLDGRLILRVQAHEGLLHRVAGAVEILKNAQGVLEERALETLESALDPC